MPDDLSKWVLDKNIPVPYTEWTNQEVRIGGIDRAGGSMLIGVFDNGKGVYNRLSFDDAENFATLILFEVKRARGEI